MSPVTLGDIALTAVAIAFAYLVYRLSRVVGKGGQILEETRSVRGVSDQTLHSSARSPRPLRRRTSSWPGSTRSRPMSRR